MIIRPEEMAYLSLLYFPISIVLSLPFIYWFRSRRNWIWWEIFFFITPLLAWWLFDLFQINLHAKSFSNAVLEILLISLVVPISVMVSGLLEGRPWRRKACVGILAALAVTAGLVHFVFPTLVD